MSKIQLMSRENPPSNPVDQLIDRVRENEHKLARFRRCPSFVLLLYTYISRGGGHLYLAQVHHTMLMTRLADEEYEYGLHMLEGQRLALLHLVFARDGEVAPDAVRLPPLPSARV